MKKRKGLKMFGMIVAAVIEMGVDCIMTDDPVLLKQILEEYR